MNEGDELKAIIAAEHGLDREASHLLQGASIEELDQSAIALAKVLGKGDEPDQREEPADDAPGGGDHADPITLALASKGQRKRALIDVFTGRAQRRDETGRFAASGSFDGGAREGLPATPETHDQTLARVLRTGEANVGGRGF